MPITRPRAMPYRLDWHGQTNTKEELNNRLSKLWIDADAMFQILFEDLKKAVDAIPASGSAPLGAEFLVGAFNPDLTAERLVLNTATITWDFSILGTATANMAALTGDVTTVAGSPVTTIANNAVTAAKIADDAVTTNKIANDAVTTAKIANDAVTTAKIANDAVTFAKMQNINASTLIGRGSAAGSGDPEEITLGAGLTMTGTVLDSVGSGTFVEWSVLTNGDVVNPELIFANGDVIMTHVP